MTPRELMLHTLALKEPVKGTLVPHFELCFFLTMESIGRVHPTHRVFNNGGYLWESMSEREKEKQRYDMVSVQIESARKYGQNGIMLSCCPWNDFEETLRQAEIARELSGDEFFLAVSMDPTFAIPDGNHLEEFVFRLADDEQGVKDEAERNLEINLERLQKIADQGLYDGVCMCSDYCFNANPFLSPDMMDEFIFPYLKRFISFAKQRKICTIKHTDGNIMPILDRLIDAAPTALHSLDPQGGVDIKEVKARTKGKLALIGNVNCGLLQTGTDEEVIGSCRYALENGMPGGGYIYATSNTVFTGMELSRYELMLSVREKYGRY